MPISLQIQIAIVALLAVAGFFIFWRTTSSLTKRMNEIFGGAGETADDLVRNLVRRTTVLETKAEELEKRLGPVEEISKISVQKVGFLRFNPFRDTGGDNSFAIALLDGEDTGVIFSSFYTREGVRVYAKKIERGEPKQVLSDEEKQVLKEAMEK